MFLNVKDLHVHYGKAEALKGISLEMEEDSIVTFIGANGAGKTTTLRTLSGLKEKSSGEIWFRGRRIDGMPAHRIVGLGIAHIPEGRRIALPLRVMDNIKIGAYRVRDKKTISENMERIFSYFPVLKERANQVAGSLSGGEQQMLATARALMTNPTLLLMDEPSMGLAPILVKEVARLIQDINRDGMSIILVEQNARMALRLAERAYILKVGQVVLCGDAKDLIHNESVKQAYLGG